MKTLIFILLCSSSYAQVVYSNNYFGMQQFESQLKRGEMINNYSFSIQHNIDGIKSHKVKSVTEETTYEKSTSKKEYQFNAFGNMASVERFGKHHYKQEVEYIADTLMSALKTTHEKTTYEIAIKYQNNLLTNYNVWRDGKLKYTHQINYTSTNQIASHTYIRKNKSALLMHDYEGKQLVETRYFEKNKLKKHWTYNCDEAGEQTIKAKENSTTCEYQEENNDGSYIKYKRTINSGKVILSKSYFSADSSFLKQEYYENDSILISSTIRERNKYTYNSYRKGKKRYAYVTEYNDNHQLISSSNYSFKKKKETYRREYSYNEKGLLTQQKTYWKEKPTSTTNYSYTYY